MADITLPGLNLTGDDVWGQTLNDAITAVNGEAEAATGTAEAALAAVATKANASTVTDLASTVAGKADDTAVVKLTGPQTVAGLKDFSTRPKVGGVNVLLTGEGGEVTPEAVITAVAATTEPIDFPEVPTVGGSPLTRLTMEPDGSAVYLTNVSVLVDGVATPGKLPLTVGTFIPDPPPTTEWLPYISNRWTGPFTSFPISGAIGSVPLTQVSQGTNQEQNAIDPSGNIYRGTNSRVNAAVTSIDLNPGVGYTVLAMAVKDVVTEGDASAGCFSELFKLASAFDAEGVAVDVSRNPTDVTIRAMRDLGTGLTYTIPAPERSTSVKVPDPATGTSLYGVLTADWHLVTLACRGATGKLFLDGVEVITNIDTTGIGVFDGIMFDAFRVLAGVFVGGYRAKDILFGRAMPLTAITAMNASLVATI